MAPRLCGVLDVVGDDHQGLVAGGLGRLDDLLQRGVGLGGQDQGRALVDRSLGQLVQTGAVHPAHLEPHGLGRLGQASQSGGVVALLQEQLRGGPGPLGQGGGHRVAAHHRRCLVFAHGQGARNSARSCWWRSVRRRAAVMMALTSATAWSRSSLITRWV